MLPRPARIAAFALVATAAALSIAAPAGAQMDPVPGTDVGVRSLAIAATNHPEPNCPTCDALNAKPGGGGPGFYGWDYSCHPGTGGTITVNVTTNGQPGVWTAGLGGTVISFTGKGTLTVTGVVKGTQLSRWIRNPQGKYVIGPKVETFFCDECDQPAPPVTAPPTTPAPAVTTPPVVGSTPTATATSVPRTKAPTVKATTPPNQVGMLPATGPNGPDTATLALGGLMVVLLGSGALCLAVNPRRR